MREIVNGSLYLVKTGCQWTMLPGNFPKWQIVYYYFSVWKKQEIWEQIHEGLVEKIRKAEGKDEEPTVGIIAFFNPLYKDQQLQLVILGGNICRAFTYFIKPCKEH